MNKRQKKGNQVKRGVKPPFKVGDKLVPKVGYSDLSYIIVKSIEWYTKTAKGTDPYWLVSCDGYEFQKTSELTINPDNWDKVV